MKQLLNMVLIVLFSQHLYGQVSIDSSAGEQVIQHLESKKIWLSDSFYIGKLNYPVSSDSLVMHPLNLNMYFYSDDYLNYVATHQVGIQYPSIGAEYPFVSKYQISGSDPVGALLELVINGFMYSLERHRLQKKK